MHIAIEPFIPFPQNINQNRKFSRGTSHNKSLPSCPGRRTMNRAGCILPFSQMLQN